MLLSDSTSFSLDTFPKVSHQAWKLLLYDFCIHPEELVVYHPVLFVKSSCTCFVCLFNSKFTSSAPYSSSLLDRSLGIKMNGSLCYFHIKLLLLCGSMNVVTAYHRQCPIHHPTSGNHSFHLSHFNCFNRTFSLL